MVDNFRHYSTLRIVCLNWDSWLLSNFLIFYFGFPASSCLDLCISQSIRYISVTINENLSVLTISSFPSFSFSSTLPYTAYTCWESLGRYLFSIVLQLSSVREWTRQLFACICAVGISELVPAEYTFGQLAYLPKPHMRAHARRPALSHRLA